MKLARYVSAILIFCIGNFPIQGSHAALRNKPSEEEAKPSGSASTGTSSSEATPAMEDQKASDSGKFSEDYLIELEDKSAVPATTTRKPSKKAFDRADAFIAGADWEFDGFVSGAQDQNLRSMFIVNDLLHLNIGRAQGVESGERIGIYKRGQKVIDPQTGKFIGYEVRRAAVCIVTDKVEEETSTVRIKNTKEPVELGDLVRRRE